MNSEDGDFASLYQGVSISKLQEQGICEVALSSLLRSDSVQHIPMEDQPPGVITRSRSRFSTTLPPSTNVAPTAKVRCAL